MSGAVELSREPEVWRCATCGSVAVKEDLPQVSKLCCPQCRSSDIFPALDGGWKALRPVSQLVDSQDDTMSGCSSAKGQS